MKRASLAHIAVVIAVLAAVPGELWLTETGGIVKFGGAFPNVKGSGLRRATKAGAYIDAKPMMLNLQLKCLARSRTAAGMSL